MAKITFRKAKRDDVALILYFIKELASYEHLLDAVEATEAGLEQSLFDQGAAEVIFVAYEGEDVGFALFFQNYSTFVGGAGIYLEDLYVLETHRGKGLGKMLLQQVAKIAVERHCGRFEWACLNWNEPSIAFYKHMGAVPMSDWTVYRLEGEALKKLSIG
ncbi:MAG: hypothetical protein PWP51_239 [Clostridiales bacterium]|jgi:GNAT superfamily N-acetyltransferase|nr:hypothetical protein [Clostridiales bacterium]MDN5297686.1 hypothetical protein [Clostridiales bacterium]